MGHTVKRVRNVSKSIIKEHYVTPPIEQPKNLSTADALHYELNKELKTITDKRSNLAQLDGEIAKENILWNARVEQAKALLKETENPKYIASIEKLHTLASKKVEDIQTTRKQYLEINNEIGKAIQGLRESLLNLDVLRNDERLEKAFTHLQIEGSQQDPLEASLSLDQEHIRNAQLLTHKVNALLELRDIN